MILRDYCVDWIIGWVACWIAFMSVFFTLEKLVLKSGLTPPRHLAICQASQAFLINLDTSYTWWIDRESSCLFDSFSIPGGSIELLFLDLMSVPRYLLDTSTIKDHLLDTYLNSFLNTCIYRDLLKVYTYLLRNPILISSISLNLHAPVYLPIPSLSHSKPLPLWFCKIFQDSSSLDKFLISHSSCISCFET